MDDLDYWAEPVDQLSIASSKIIELVGLVFEYLEHVVGRTAGYAVGKKVIGQVYPDLGVVVGESCVKDLLKR